MQDAASLKSGGRACPIEAGKKKKTDAQPPPESSSAPANVLRMRPGQRLQKRSYNGGRGIAAEHGKEKLGEGARSLGKDEYTGGS